MRALARCLVRKTHMNKLCKQFTKTYLILGDRYEKKSYSTPGERPPFLVL